MERFGRGIRMESATAALPLSVGVRPFIEVNGRCAASHATAAELHGLPQRRQNEGLEAYHLIRPEGAAHLARPHVIVHRMKLFRDEVMSMGGLPITTPARTWLDMAEMLDSARPKKPWSSSGRARIRPRKPCFGWR